MSLGSLNPMNWLGPVSDMTPNRGTQAGLPKTTLCSRGGCPSTSPTLLPWASGCRAELPRRSEVTRAGAVRGWPSAPGFVGRAGGQSGEKDLDTPEIDQS